MRCPRAIGRQKPHEFDGARDSRRFKQELRTFVPLQVRGTYTNLSSKPMDAPIRCSYTTSDFESWQAGKSLSLTPKFQRRGVWTPAARSFFIDTLLRGMPVPPVYIRVRQSDNHARTIREVIDGQQRISAVLAYIGGEYRLSRTLRGPWAGKSVEALTKQERERLYSYAFSAEVFQGISDLEVLEVFSRLNTYSVSLNAQELRNGRYFGAFKQVVYTLAHEHLEFWRRHKAFSEQSIARMLEVEFASEIVIAQLAGMQDKKKSIDDYYEKYDDSFPKQAQVVRRFTECADEIGETFDSLSTTGFHRPPLLYTLFLVVYHKRFGLPGTQEATSKKALSSRDRHNLRNAVDLLSEKLELARTEHLVEANFSQFVGAASRQTDNLKPRQIRFRVLYGLSKS